MSFLIVVREFIPDQTLQNTLIVFVHKIDLDFFSCVCDSTLFIFEAQFSFGKVSFLGSNHGRLSVIALSDFLGLPPCGGSWAPSFRRQVGVPSLLLEARRRKVL